MGKGILPILMMSTDIQLRRLALAATVALVGCSHNWASSRLAIAPI